MSAKSFPFDKPVRLVQDSEGIYEVWTAYDSRPGSRNNFAIAIGIQGELDATFIRDSINLNIVRLGLAE